MKLYTFKSKVRSIIRDEEVYRLAYALLALGTTSASIYASIEFYDGCRELQCLQCLQVFWYWIGIAVSLLGLMPVLSYFPAIAESSIGQHCIFRKMTHFLGISMIGIAWFVILIDP